MWLFSWIVRQRWFEKVGPVTFCQPIFNFNYNKIKFVYWLKEDIDIIIRKYYFIWYLHWKSLIFLKLRQDALKLAHINRQKSSAISKHKFTRHALWVSALSSIIAILTTLFYIMKTLVYRFYWLYYSIADWLSFYYS